jgi:hypothetical protein
MLPPTFLQKSTQKALPCPTKIQSTITTTKATITPLHTQRQIEANKI